MEVSTGQVIHESQDIVDLAQIIVIQSSQKFRVESDRPESLGEQIVGLVNEIFGDELGEVDAGNGREKLKGAFELVILKVVVVVFEVGLENTFVVILGVAVIFEFASGHGPLEEGSFEFFEV